MRHFGALHFIQIAHDKVSGRSKRFAYAAFRDHPHALFESSSTVAAHSFMNRRIQFRLLPEKELLDLPADLHFIFSPVRREEELEAEFEWPQHQDAFQIEIVHMGTV